MTRNSSVDEIGERYRLNHAIVVKLYHPNTLYNTLFPRNVRLSYRQIATFSAHRDVFDYRALQIFLLTYLPTDQFLVDNYLLQFMVGKFLLQRPRML